MALSLKSKVSCRLRVDLYALKEHKHLAVNPVIRKRASFSWCGLTFRCYLRAVAFLRDDQSAFASKNYVPDFVTIIKNADAAEPRRCQRHRRDRLRPTLVRILSVEGVAHSRRSLIIHIAILLGAYWAGTTAACTKSTRRKISRYNSLEYLNKSLRGC